jgi:hypothetical protein
MNKLFDRGYQMAQNGYPWEEYPPGWYKALRLEK